MNTHEPRCAKCGGAMHRGWIVDRGPSRGGDFQALWVKGDPTPSFWSAFFGGEAAVTPEHEVHRVRTFRCEQCGYLEMYAP